MARMDSAAIYGDEVKRTGDVIEPDWIAANGIHVGQPYPTVAYGTVSVWVEDGDAPGGETLQTFDRVYIRFDDQADVSHVVSMAPQDLARIMAQGQQVLGIIAQQIAELQQRNRERSQGTNPDA